MRNYLYISVLFTLVLIAAGCKHNVYHVDKNIQCPVSYSFKAPYEKTWDAAVEAVMAQSTIDTIDKKSGYISTDITTVDGQEMNFMDHVFFGQTYKFTYDIRIRSQGAKVTRVSTNVKLFVEQFMGISQRESDWGPIENYLREKLYKEICRNLYPNNTGDCSRGFSSSTASTNNPEPTRNVLPVPRKRIDEKVQVAQKALNSAGYNPGPADGLMGRKTLKAIETYQSDNGLTVTGQLDQETYELLTQYEYQESASASEPEYTPPPARSTPKPMPPPEKEVVRPIPDKPAKKPTGKYVTTDITDLLQEQDLFGSEIIGNVPAGTVLRVLSKNGEYYKVKFKGKEGYIYGEFVEEN